MDHLEIRRKLPAYLDDEVSAEEKQDIKRHLGSCGICRAALADLELTMWHLKQLPEVEPPPWLSSKILAKVQTPAEPRRSLLRRLFSSLPVKLLLVVLVLALLGSTYFILRAMRPDVTPASPPQTISRGTAPRPAPAPAASQGAATIPAPSRAPSSVSTPSPSGMPAAVPFPGNEAPPPVSPPAPAATPAPAPALHEEHEQQPADETALPGKEAVQPFGQEGQGAPQDEKR